MKKLIALLLLLITTVQLNAQEFKYLGTAKVTKLKESAAAVGAGEGSYVLMSGKFGSFVSIDKKTYSSDRLGDKSFSIKAYNPSFQHREVKLNGENFTIFHAPNIKYLSSKRTSYFVLAGTVYGKVLCEYEFKLKTTDAIDMSDNGKYVAYISSNNAKLIKVISLYDNEETQVRVDTRFERESYKLYVSNTGVPFILSDGQAMSKITAFFDEEDSYLAKFPEDIAFGNIELKFLDDNTAVLHYVIDVKPGEEKSGKNIGYGIGAHLLDISNNQITIKGDYHTYYDEETIMKFNASIKVFSNFRDKSKHAKWKQLNNYSIYDIKYINGRLFILAGSDYLHIMTSSSTNSTGGVSTSTNYFYHYDPMILTVLGGEETKSELLIRSFTQGWEIYPPMVMARGKNLFVIYNNKIQKDNFIQSFEFNEQLDRKHAYIQKVVVKKKSGEVIDFNYLEKEDDNSYIVYSRWGKRLNFFRMTLE